MVLLPTYVLRPRSTSYIREVVRLPLLDRLQLLHHRDERAVLREEDHIACEVLLDLLAEVRVGAPHDPRILAEEDALESLELACGIMRNVSTTCTWRSRVLSLPAECEYDLVHETRGDLRQLEVTHEDALGPLDDCGMCGKRA